MDCGGAAMGYALTPLAELLGVFLSHITQGCRGMCLLYLWLSSAQTLAAGTVRA